MKIIKLPGTDFLGKPDPCVSKGPLRIICGVYK